MTAPVQRFNLLGRLLHWLMALLVLTMLLLGVGMMSTVSPRFSELFGWHRSIGAVVLVLVAIRLINRLLRGAPPLPDGLPRWQKAAAKGSHVALYLLMFAIPLAGWAALSAGAYPVVIFGVVELPPVVDHSDRLFTILRTAHIWLAFALFSVWLLHFAAALFHRLIRRDTVLQSMT